METHGLPSVVISTSPVTAPPQLFPVQSPQRILRRARVKIPAWEMNQLDADEATCAAENQSDRVTLTSLPRPQLDEDRRWSLSDPTSILQRVNTGCPKLLVNDKSISELVQGGNDVTDRTSSVRAVARVSEPTNGVPLSRENTWHDSSRKSARRHSLQTPTLLRNLHNNQRRFSVGGAVDMVHFYQLSRAALRLNSRKNNRRRDTKPIVTEPSEVKENTDTDNPTQPRFGARLSIPGQRALLGCYDDKVRSDLQKEGVKLPPRLLIPPPQVWEPTQISEAPKSAPTTNSEGPEANRLEQEIRRLKLTESLHKAQDLLDSARADKGLPITSPRLTSRPQVPGSAVARAEGYRRWSMSCVQEFPLATDGHLMPPRQTNLQRRDAYPAHR